MKLLSAILMALAVALPAHAADITISVRDGAGRPVKDAVVSVYPASGVPRGTLRTADRYVLAQRGLQFDPYVLVVPVGGTVTFPNFDKVRHHIYSLVGANRFEIELYGRQEDRSHTFARVGVAALGCNIHDQMLAYVKVVDTPWAAKTTANGDIVVSNLPAGAATVKVWHPTSTARGGEVSQAITLAATGAQRATVSVALRGG